MNEEKDIKFRRNYKACLNCRTRKVRCDLGPVESPHDPPCARCRRERKECVFAESRRGGQPKTGVKRRQTESVSATPDPVSAAQTRNNSVGETVKPSLQSLTQAAQFYQQQEKLQNVQQQQQTSSQYHSQLQSRQNSSQSVSQRSPEENQIPPPPTRPSDLTSIQGALVFLAKAAGTIAKADDRDNINAREIHEKFDDQDSSNSSITNSRANSAVVNNNNNNTQSNGQDDDQYENSVIAPLIRPHGKKPTSMPPISKTANVHPNPSKRLTDIEYIGPNKMLSEFEAERLIKLFFLTMHPFFPHIPTQLHDPQTLPQYPILLCAILTISSRYHPLEPINSAQVNKNSKNVQLHERLWIYCQRLISQTVWAEASTRSIGTVLAFLLFTEWNPRAIHWRWSDYANNKDDMGPEGPELHNNENSNDDGEGLAGLGAMRRSDRMAWMLVGTSVRLAQDMGFINSSSKIFIATHIAETHTAMNIGQRSMLAQSLGEIDLDNEDDDEVVDSKKQFQNDELILSLDEDYLLRNNSQIKKNTLKFSMMQKAKLELLKIMSLAYETLYCGKYQLNGNNQIQNLTALSILSPLIENWYKSYKKLLKPSNPKNFNQHCNVMQADNIKHVNDVTKQVDKESLICDYYYTQLYIYSLALTMENTQINQESGKKQSNNFRLDEISKAAKYVELAYNAAKETLTAAIRVHKLKMLRYMPVRWVTRIVRSVAFIVKCFLTLTNNNNNNNSNQLSNNNGSVLNPQASTILTLSIIPTEEIIQTIQKAAIVLREASPDELHLCTRYSTILMYLCSEMKYRSKLSINPPNLTKLSADSDEEDEQNQVSNVDLQQDQSHGLNNNDIPMGQEQQQSQQSTENLNNQQLPNMYNFGYPSNSEQAPLPDAVVDWFLKNDEAIGLDFVEPWTEMIEQHLDKKKN
ncbi:Transcriptional activator ARO80 [Wickerhamomyces ciferrii]|uniref:Transcriptional activator ARO80 n=1 Tax=Wickerhamomyces ciferrii (strain ATCC 14091 / BCRC 22168 / CBS 111 / JCM 3599 / NBRC 0793 / NRRL Y-1031 F-60-10) TaxID=1206466 RepID=K0KXM3_WICCF|nr:Transcriptional activator ARO80 [Wickerhamomyces ciferrii]CCH45798.1 Transcriptional activator ARO80 [Wickerhamomyces ciferrii]